MVLKMVSIYEFLSITNIHGIKELIQNFTILYNTSGFWLSIIFKDSTADTLKIFATRQTFITENGIKFICSVVLLEHNCKASCKS